MIVFWVICVIVVLFGFVVFRGAPYVPSKPRDIAKAFDELYPLSEKDVLVDIGSGDGIVLRAAARRGARAVGYELNPVLVLISRILSRGNKKIEVRVADFWRKHFPDDTTVVYTFGDSRDIRKMAALVQQEANRLGRELYFISYGFAVPGKEAVNKTGVHFLYHFDALQGEKA